MAQTVIRGAQILNNTVQRQDLDTSTVGQAVVTKIVQGTNVSLSSTGADSGTGDVTISSQGLQWKGTWNSVTAYVVNDQVIRYGSHYIALANNTNADPGTVAGTANYGNTAQGGTSGGFTGISAVKISVTASGILKNLSMFIATAGVNCTLGLYTDSSGVPGTLLATTATFVSSVGLNTVITTTSPTLSIIDYWVAVLNQSTITGYYNTGGNASWNGSQAWGGGALPSTWPGGSSTGAFNYSMYATLTVSTNWAAMATGGQAGLSTDSGNIASGGSDGLILVPQSQIWSVRLRSFNAVGNPTFEVDQRTAGAGIVNPAAGVFPIDRWANSRAGLATMTYNMGQAVPSPMPAVPGTSFAISSKSFLISLTAQQASLAAGDVALAVQSVEGPQLRELIGDVHSVSIMAYTNVAGGLKFALSLRDPAQAHSYVHLCTLTAANVWQLITIPNIPVFSASGNFGTTPGTNGYILGICFASGTTYITSANDAWVNMNAVGAIGMDNLGSKPVGSQLLLGYIGHEPGAPTTPIDCSFTQNYDDCLRYFSKSYLYNVKPGTVSASGQMSTWIPLANNNLFGWFRFPKPMAKIPTVNAYSPSSGAVNALYDASTSADRAVNSVAGIGDAGYSDVITATNPAGLWWANWHHVADTGW